MLKIVLVYLIIESIGAQIDLEKFPGESCYRECRGATPRVCYFNWHLEHYHVLGAYVSNSICSFRFFNILLLVLVGTVEEPVVTLLIALEANVSPLMELSEAS